MTWVMVARNKKTTAGKAILRRIADAVAGRERERRLIPSQRKARKAKTPGSVQSKPKQSGAAYPNAKIGTVWVGDVPYKECARCPPGQRLFPQSAFSPHQWSRTRDARFRACLRCMPDLTLPKGTRYCRKCANILPLSAFEQETARRLHGGYTACVECSKSNENQTKRRTPFKLAPKRKQGQEHRH